MDVELLVVPDCPNADPAARLLNMALTEVGLGYTAVRDGRDPFTE